MNELAKSIASATDDAISFHGEYTFHDRPAEVVNMDELSKLCRKAGVKETYEAFKSLILLNENGGIVVAKILNCLEDWDELWDSYDEVGEWY